MESMQEVYLKRNPTAKAVLDLVHSVDNDKLCYDHLAFRTFGVLLLLYYLLQTFSFRFVDYILFHHLLEAMLSIPENKSLFKFCYEIVL